MAWGMGLMLDDADFRAIPRNLRSFGGQTGNETEQIHRDVLGELRRQNLGYAGLPVSVRQQIPDRSRASGCTVTGRDAEVRVPEHVVPIRMRREAATTGWPNSRMSFARAAISSPVIPGSMSNTPARPCTTTALFWSNSLWWNSTPSVTCANMEPLPFVGCSRLSS